MHSRSGYWICRTRAGTCAIRRLSDGRWHAILDGESLGGYHTPQQALDDLLGGHTFSPSSGVDTSELDLPYELGDWEFVPER